MDQQTAQQVAEKVPEGFSIMSIVMVLIPPAIIGWVSGTMATTQKVAAIEAKLDQVAKQTDTILTHLLDRQR